MITLPVPFYRTQRPSAALACSDRQTCGLRDIHLTECVFASVSVWVSLSAVRADCVQQRTELRTLERESKSVSLGGCTETTTNLEGWTNRLSQEDC